MNMAMKQVAVVTFSPTRTSYKVAKAISKGTNLPVVEYDVTYAAPGKVEFGKDTLVVISLPVYGGDIPALARERLEDLEGHSTPAVIVSVYGNRDFEKSVVKTNSFVRQRGFIPVAAGAFVGEHSYSTAQYRVAAGRPNDEDLREAEEFGKAVIEKLNTVGSMAVDVARVKAPSSGVMNVLGFVCFILGYRRKQKKSPTKIVVRTDETLCRHCGACVGKCPTGAIRVGEEHMTDADKCIKCCACIKQCPTSARLLDTPFAPVLAKYFKKPKRNVVCLK